MLYGQAISSSARITKLSPDVNGIAPDDLYLVLDQYKRHVAVLGGYTLAFPSSALLDLTGDVEGLPKDYRFNTLLSELFAVRN